MQRPLWNRLATFLVWLLAALCCVYWALKFVRGSVAPLSAAVAAPASSVGAVDTQSLAIGLGGGKAPAGSSPTEAPAAPSALQAARFLLTGVVVQKTRASSGVALIAVDGKPPRPYRVGSQLTDGVVLHSVAVGKALLSSAMDAAPSLTLDLPQIYTASVGNARPSRPALQAEPYTPSSNSPLPIPSTNNANADPDNMMGGSRPSRRRPSRSPEMDMAIPSQAGRADARKAVIE
jgi:general secretion pathway protein C